MTTTDVIASIEEIAPLAGAAAWDNSGVQVLGTVETITKVAVSIDPSPEAVGKALDQGAEFILTHHPLYRDPMPLSRPGYFMDTARAVITAGAWLYAAHTSLDVQVSGPAGWLFRELGLTNLDVLEPNGPDQPGEGFGFVGSLPEAMPYKAFSEKLGTTVERGFWTITGQPPARVSKVAYCTGSGASLMPQAQAAGADVYVTGDLKYHQALESGQFTIDVGHFSLEERMTRDLAKLLAERLGPQGIDVFFIPGRDPFQAHLPQG